MATNYGKGRTAKGKQNKKVVGRLEKEKKRKQRTSSRLAQRTGISARERGLDEMLKRIDKGLEGLFGENFRPPKKVTPMPFKKSTSDLDEFHKKLRRDKILSESKKKGGKVK